MVLIQGFHIGQMRSSVHFLNNVPTQSANNEHEEITTGGWNDVYGTLLLTRGRLRKQSGGRDLAFGLIAGNDSYELICRFQATLEAALQVNGKVIVDSVNYTIASWEKVDQINHIYKFKLNTQVA
jgi:hypothetical protein